MEAKPHVCPVWVGYLMSSPIRKLQQNPYKILGPYITPGMNILELGPAMGYFSIPMAKMTGKTGKVYCVDIQENMLDKLNKRSQRKGVYSIIDTILSDRDSFNIHDLQGSIDFTLLAYMVHEVPDQARLFREVALAMETNAKVLLIEPKMHVKENDWRESLRIASENGFVLSRSLKISGSRAFELMRA